MPGAALARELREELGIDIAAPSGPPVQEVRGDTFDMQIWLIEAWTGSPANVEPGEHDAIAWFTEDALGELSLAHDSYLAIFSQVLAQGLCPRDRDQLAEAAVIFARAVDAN
jgi:8-oxo-dGTP diphosphatase